MTTETTANAVKPQGVGAMPGTERSFGLSVGAFLCGIAAALVWRHRPIRGEVIGVIGATLMLLGTLRPALLKWPRVWWWRVARRVGDFNARVLLAIMFVLVLVPLGIIWRLMGKDPLARRRNASNGWLPYPSRYGDRHHYRRMY